MNKTKYTSIDIKNREAIITDLIEQRENLIKYCKDKISETLESEYIEDEMWKYDKERKIYKDILKELEKGK